MGTTRSIIVFCAIFRFSQPSPDYLAFGSLKTRRQVNMSKIFNWEYFSFVTLDDAVAYKEVLVVPAVIFVLSMVWMQLVKGQGEEEVKKEETERKINFEQAYQDAVMNEVDSGTELDSQGEEEEEAAATENKDKEEKKDD